MCEAPLRLLDQTIHYRRDAQGPWSRLAAWESPPCARRPSVHRLPARLGWPPRASTHTACGCVPSRLPSAAALPVSFRAAAAVRVSAPAPDPSRFRLPSPSWAAVACTSALSTRIEVCCPTPVFHVQPFALRLLWPRLTSGDSSQP